MTISRGNDYFCSVSTIPALDAEKCNFTFTFTLIVEVPSLLKSGRCDDKPEDGKEIRSSKAYGYKMACRNRCIVDGSMGSWT